MFPSTSTSAFDICWEIKNIVKIAVFDFAVQPRFLKTLICFCFNLVCYDIFK